MMKIMRMINTSESLILMGKLVPFSIPLHMKNSLTMMERILCPWEVRDMLNPKINLGS